MGGGWEVGGGSGEWVGGGRRYGEGWGGEVVLVEMSGEDEPFVEKHVQ